MLPRALILRSVLLRALTLLGVCASMIVIAPAPASSKPARGGGSKQDQGGEGDEGDDGGDDEDNSKDEERKNKERDEDPTVITVIVATPLDYLETPCVEEKAADKCLEAGILWKKGVAGFKEGKPDLRRADNFLRTACYFGNARGCVLAAKMHLAVEAGIILGRDGGVILDFATATDLFERGCALGDLSACGMGGDLYFAPDAMLPNDQTSYGDFAEDHVAARQFYETGCPAGWLPGGALRAELEAGTTPPVDARSCTRLGEFFARGITRRPIARIGAEYMELACIVDDSEEICDRAEVLREAALEEEARKAKGKKHTNPDDDFVGKTTGRGTGALASSRPATGRFDDSSIGTEGVESIVRFEFELPIGVRWVYGPTIEPLFTVGFAIDFWFALFGLGVDFSYSTDDLLRSSARDYGRIQLAILAKVALPIPVRLTIPARLVFIPSIGGAFGSRSLAGSDTPAYLGAIVERVELRLTSPQRKGARQWGAIRFEQQQSFIQYTFGGVEHGSQVMFIFGFTFGGVGPEMPTPKERAGDE